MSLRKVWESPWLIPALSVMTVFALAAAVWAVFGVMAGDLERERDRIAVDLSSCERGNVGRQSDIDVAYATEDLIQGILDVVFANVRDPNTAEALEDQMAPLFAEHRAVVDRIELIDCESVVLGSR